MTFNLFLEWKPTEKIKPMMPVARGTPVHKVAVELKITADLSTFVTSVSCLYSSFSVLQKLEVVQGTTEYSYFRNREILITGPSCPQAVVLGQQAFFNMLETRRTISLEIHSVIKY